MQKPLVRIVDDDADLRDALQFALSVEGIESQAFPDARAFLTGDVPSRPGCAILDVRMPGVNGLELQKTLNERHYPHPVLFLSAHGDIDMAVVCMQEGAVDFLQKPIGTNERLIAAIRRAIELDAKVSGHPTSAFEADALVSTLTPKERQVAALVARGMISADISARLGISDRTVDTHRHSICRKLKTTSPERIRALLLMAGLEL